MNDLEVYRMYSFANHLAKQHHFEILHINEENEEIWLVKYQDKQSIITRIFHKDYNWKNHLKQDIGSVFQRVKSMGKLLQGKQIIIHNVYIAKHTPVDDWELLKKPMVLREKKPIAMHVYYMDENNFEQEEARYFKTTGMEQESTHNLVSEENLSLEIEHHKQELESMYEHQRKQTEGVFHFGKPLLTYIILALNILMFIVLELKGGSNSIETLIQFGAKYNPAIMMDGEWWRIITSMFLHIGFLHLAMNMLAVYYLGTLVERIYGSWRFFIIYMLAGISGGLASFTFSMSVSAGASGALFGLFGALLFFGTQYRHLFFQTMGTNVLVLIVINLIFGFSVPQIDNGAHIGGLIAGFIAAAIVSVPGKRKLLTQATAILIYVLASIGLIYFGIENNENNAAYQLAHIEELVQENEYEEIIDRATKALENPGDFESVLLFQRSYAYIGMEKYDLAIKDLEQSIALDELPEAYFNLAILYQDTGETEKADQAVRKAYELNPDDDMYQELYEEITGETAK
ncbi:rhomboid family intramembrane serine protease [Ornithinibacillus gellani]|uniref:rhomboid family intramembrane serine protease n=1 Tax=Ornithinibacillus gellani TaxID=2293253 RepID=UPI000F4790DE|nr:rhomboid family intramembrane serine protease [Ornithinibacillus gellani]TQS74547.1 rhomboid family intramembrane serine protease [Ornithinibacillus gellani]